MSWHPGDIADPMRHIVMRNNGSPSRWSGSSAAQKNLFRQRRGGQLDCGTRSPWPRGARSKSARPSHEEVAERAFTAKVKVLKPVRAPGGGCGSADDQDVLRICCSRHPEITLGDLGCALQDDPHHPLRLGGNQWAVHATIVDRTRLDIHARSGDVYIQNRVSVTKILQVDRLNI